MRSVTRITKLLLDGIWRALAALLILLALVVQLGRMATPMVADYRQPLVHYVERTTGLQVSIKSLAAQWDSLLPVLVIEGLQVSDEQGSPVLSVESALAEVDLLQTLIDRQLRLADVEFLGLKSHFIQTAEGGYRLAGMQPKAKAQAAEQTPSRYSLDDLRGLFMVGKNVRLVDLQTELTLASGHQLELVVNQVLLEHSADRHRLSVDVQIDQQPEAVRVVLEGSGDPFDIDEFGTRGYVKIDQLPTEKVMALLARQYWQGLPQGRWRKEGELSVEAWFDLMPDSGLDFVGVAKLTGLPFELDGRQIPLRKMSANITGDVHFDGDWQMQLSQINLAWGERAHPEFAINFGADSNGEKFFKADRLVLSLWSQWLNRLAVLPPKLQELAEDLSPSGELENVHLSWRQRDLKDLLIRANLKQVSAGDWHGAPAVTGVDGYVQSSLREGYVLLDSHAGFSMHYTTVYDEPMVYQKASGHVSWWIRPEQHTVYVNSGPIQLAGDDGQATGFLYIDIPTQKNVRPVELLLQIGIRNSAARFHKKYVPNVVSENLRHWLDQSVKAGDVRAGGFLFHGFLRAANRPPSVQLWLDIDHAELAYSDRWPALRDAQAELLLDRDYLLVNSNRAEVLNSQARTVRVMLETENGQRWLNIDGAIKGPLTDAQQLLSDSALADITGGIFSSWQLGGTYNGQLDLHIPLALAAQKPGYQVDLALSDGSVTIPALALSADKLTGKLQVSDQSGVVLKGMRGSLWSHPLTINSKLNKAGDTINLVLKSQLAATDILKWMRVDPISQLTGSSQFDVYVDIPWQRADAKARLSINSDLVGMASNLPEPLDKAAQQAMSLHISLPLDTNRLQLDGAIGAYVNTRLLWLRNGEKLAFDRGDVQFNGTARLPDQPMLSIGMQLDHLALAPWKKLLENYPLTPAQQSPDESAVGGGFPPVYVSLYTDNLWPVAEHNLGAASFEAIRSSERWMFNLRNERVAGALTLPFSDDPVDLSLSYLRLPLWPALTSGESTQGESTPGESTPGESTQGESTPGESTPGESTPGDATPEPVALADRAIWSQLTGLPDMNVSVGQIYYREKNIGQLGFQSSTRNDNLTIGHLTGHLFELQFVADDQNRQPFIIWQPALARSRAEGRLMVGDLGTTLESLGMAKLIESRSGQFDLNLNWSGTPSTLAMKNLEGDVLFNVSDGRFLRQDASAGNALMRLMGIFNFDTWIRRLQLDFSDVYASGMAYDRVQGDLSFNQGKVLMRTPVSVKTPSSKMQMAGSVDLISNQLDTQLTVNLPVLDNLTFIAAVSAGLPVAAGVFVASRLFEKQFDQMTSVNYTVTGSLDEPDMKFVQISTPRDSAAKPATKPLSQPADVVDKTRTPAPDTQPSPPVEPPPTQ